MAQAVEPRRPLDAHVTLVTPTLTSELLVLLALVVGPALHRVAPPPARGARVDEDEVEDLADGEDGGAEEEAQEPAHLERQGACVCVCVCVCV